MKNGIKHKILKLESCGIQIKNDSTDDLLFSGYASVFNGVDSYGDTVLPGAYENTLKNRHRPVRMRWNHFGPVIGKWIELKEDKKGLFVTGELTPGHSTADDVWASLKHGAVDGLSIGYRVLDSEPKDEPGEILKEIELVEISVVEEPADRAAQISEVKSCIETATTIRELEALLRDAAGFSKANAAAFISRVKGCLGDPEHANSENATTGIDFRALVNESCKGLYKGLTERSNQNET